MKNINFSLLYKILEIQSESHNCLEMQAFLWDYAEKNNWLVDCDDIGNLYITKGMSVTYPCVVAHMDTVHSIQNMNTSFSDSQTTYGKIVPVLVDGVKITGIDPATMRQTGIGGDDKCGIYVALEALNTLDVCKVVFFVDEEVGCVGSYQCDIDFFTDVRFILQADRRGKSDFVNDIWGPISSEKFCQDVQPFLQKYKFNFVEGMMTDVQALRDRFVGVSCANISAGYYNPHQDHEFIDTLDLQNTMNLMLDICNELQDVYPFTAPAKKTHKNPKAFCKDIDDYCIDDDPFSFVPEKKKAYLSAKSISEMTDAEWIEYNNQLIENDLDLSVSLQYDQDEDYPAWWKSQLEPNNPFV
jgi:tripeptide aminopeptidase